MSTLLWQKKESVVDDRMMAFMSGDDVVLDREFFLFDIRASIAHVHGLAQEELLDSSDASDLVRELEALAGDFTAGEFVLDATHEDGHSAIEARLTERLGETGARVHLGRSRNDQALTAIRLYSLDALREARAIAVECGRAAIERAREHEFDPMPGYTHLQRAMPSTVGLWMASFAESFADDAALLAFTERWIDACPLGTAAGYGVNLPLARDEVAAELGFGRVQLNPMHAQASRGKYEVQVVSALWQFMQTIRRLAWDLSLFSAPEFGFVQLPAGATTGSSIMPNKRNPDLAELLRGSAGVIGGAMAELMQTVSLPSGYHRDLQLTKGPLVRACTTARQAGALVPDLVRGLSFDLARMRDAIDPTMFATDRAVDLARGGMAFRDAYRQIGDNLEELEAADADLSARERVSPGACADLRLDLIAARLDNAGMNPL